jgi:serine/threonine protein kinase
MNYLCCWNYWRMAPEVKKGFYSFSADVYSLGLVLYEIFENQLPYYDMITQTVHLPPQFKVTQQTTFTFSIHFHECTGVCVCVIFV